MTAPWTDAHRREALLLIGRCIAAGMCSLPMMVGDHDTRTEEGFRRFVVREIDVDDDPSVRQVRDFAEGRKVREPSERYAVVRSDGMRPATFEAKISAHDYITERSKGITGKRFAYKIAVVRVTRIRRAP